MPARKTKILVVEDSETVAMLQLGLLESHGYEVRHAANGTDGLVFIHEWVPDILVLDITLPDMDGLDILRKVQLSRPETRPDVVVLSGHDDPEVTFASLRAGAQDFIRKPFHHEEYLLRISAVERLRTYRLFNDALQSQLESDLRKLSRYFSKDLIEAILEGSIAADPGGDISTATFLMFDLRSSTTIAEQMGPRMFFQFLSSFFADISDLIYSCNGAINKFTGDGYLVTFGLRDYTPAATINALECALKIREHIAMYNDMRPENIKQPIGFGIGITTGEVFAGNIGNVHKLEYTILGDAVNYIKEGVTLLIAFENGANPITAEAPSHVVVNVTYTEPGVAGDTATRTLKPATIETGAEIRVPLFINTGDNVKIDTHTGEYIERVK